MSEKNQNNVKNWYNRDYKLYGLKAQRFYPNEELLRFMGRNYFKYSFNTRKNIKILELGSGSCANLWMISKEGFDAYGVDISVESIKLGQEMLNHWKTDAHLKRASMTSLPYKKNYFDSVIDIYGSCCLNEKDFIKCLKETHRVLKKGGKFFCFTLGKNSHEFINHSPSKLIDKSTLSNIKRLGSPHYGNNYPLRYIHADEVKSIIKKNNFEIKYLETNNRTYSNRSENIELISLEAIKL
jgi:ubiquinone/menaquinone biosynthesis C-methylase UbiE